MLDHRLMPGLRYANTSTAKTATTSISSRYPITRDWRLNPRLRVDYRKNDRDDSTQWTAMPSLRMDYRWRRKYRFELDAGGEWSTRDFNEDTEKSTSWFINTGYRIDF